jgi:hypothetical protein
MGKVILMQRTVDWVFKKDKNAVVRFEQLGYPEIVEENGKIEKYYRYEEKGLEVPPGSK